MSLPNFNEVGDLPPGIYRVTMVEVVRRFGCGTPARENAAKILNRIFDLAKKTGHLERVVIFGSFVTAKPMPNDVDLVLVMDDDFQVNNCNNEAAIVFDHNRAESEIGASVF